MKKLSCVLAAVLLLCCFSTGVFALPHNKTVFTAGDQFATVPEGTLAEFYGKIYVDVEKFYALFGYRSYYYPDAEMVLLVNYNHRVLYMNGKSVYNEVGDFSVKSAPSESWKLSPRSNVKVGMDKPLIEAADIYQNVMYIRLEDALKVFGFTYHFDRYGRIEVGSLAGFPGYHGTTQEIREFARVLHHETMDSSMFKKTAVGGVIMNRVYSPNWPNTIMDVIFQPNQFTPANYEYFAATDPSLLHYEGAVRSINGENTAPNCFYFNLAPFKGMEGKFYQIIEGDYFYYE